MEMSIDMIRRQISHTNKAYRKAMGLKSYALATRLAEEYDDLKAMEYKILNPTFAALCDK